MDVVWDMETNDPDDFLTLLFLLGHPQVNLIGVTVMPGTPEQIGVVRRALEWFDHRIPVGSFNVWRQGGKPGSAVSPWHYAAYGDVSPSSDAVPGPDLLRDLCADTTTLITGAPLRNLGAALKLPGFTLGRLVAQGGFAGNGVVPPDRQLPKFRGMETCPSFNLNGDPKAALAATTTPAIADKRFVSKNVCHGVAYDNALHEQVAGLRNHSRSLGLIWKGMEHYLKHEPRGKLLHDPLAACAAVDPAVAEWAEVEIYRSKGAWGSRCAPGSGVFITVGYDHERFLATLLETG